MQKIHEHGHPEFADATPDLPETFEAEFKNGLGKEARRAMRSLGNFDFHGSEGIPGSEPSEIIYSGSRADGTKIEIKFTKGTNYISPAQELRKSKERVK